MSEHNEQGNLLPCPFCGVLPETKERNPIIMHTKDCIFTEGHVLHVSEYKAWNTRTSPAQPEVKGVVEALEEAQADAELAIEDFDSKNQFGEYRGLNALKKINKELSEAIKSLKEAKNG